MSRSIKYFKDTENVKLISLELYTDYILNVPQYYLKATYQVENEKGVYHITIPKIYLPVDASHLPNINTIDGKVDIGFGGMYMRTVNGVLMTETCIKEKVRDMTVKEIEKKLGFKIRIVSGNQDKE